MIHFRHIIPIVWKLILELAAAQKKNIRIFKVRRADKIAHLALCKCEDLRLDP